MGTLEVGDKVEITFYTKALIGIIMKKIGNSYRVKHEGTKYALCYPISYLRKIKQSGSKEK